MWFKISINLPLLNLVFIIHKCICRGQLKTDVLYKLDRCCMFLLHCYSSQRVGAYGLIFRRSGIALSIHCLSCNERLNGPVIWMKPKKKRSLVSHQKWHDKDPFPLKTLGIQWRIQEFQNRGARSWRRILGVWGLFWFLLHTYPIFCSESREQNTYCKQWIMATIKVYACYKVKV